MQRNVVIVCINGMWQRNVKPKQLPESCCLRTRPLRDENLPIRPIRNSNNPSFFNVIPSEIKLTFEPFWDINAKHPDFEEIVVYPGKIHSLFLYQCQLQILPFVFLTSKCSHIC